MYGFGFHAYVVRLSKETPKGLIYPYLGYR